MFSIIFLSGFNVCFVYLMYNYLKSNKSKKTKIYPKIDNDVVIISNEKGDIESCII